MSASASVESLTVYVNRGITPKYTVEKEGSILILNQKCIRGFKVSLEPARLNDLSKRKITEGKLLEKYDVLINSTGVGTLGRVAQFYGESGSATVDSHVTIVRPNADLIDPVYFGYIIKSKQQLIEGFAEGTTGQTELSRDSVKELLVDFVEDKVKQKEIGQALLAIDKKIELNRQTNQTLEHIAQAIFKSWFVDFEPTRAKIAAKQIRQARQDGERSAALKAALFADGRWPEAVAAAIAEGDPERAAMAAISGKALDELDQLSPEQKEQLLTTAALFPDALVDSELGGIPKGWEVKALDEIAHYQNGLALQKFRPEDENNFLPVLKIAQLKKGFADGEEKASPNIKPECIVDNGDVVFSWSGSLVVDVWCGGKAALNQHLFKVTSPDYPKWFYCYWTKHHLETFQQVAADKAVTMGHIKRSHLAEAKCIVPSCDLDQFSLMANFLEKQIEQRLESIALQEIRDSLLPKLLSGESSIPEHTEHSV